MLGRRTFLASLPAMVATPALAQGQVGPPMAALASFSILADITRAVGGGRVTVTSLAPIGIDLHHFQPRPSEARSVSTARVFVINGLGLEGWAERLAVSAGFKGTGVVASKGVKVLSTGDGHGHHGHAHGKAEPDPHCWQDVANVRIYVANIRDGLMAADPTGQAAYAEQATAYLSRLGALDAEIKAMIAPIPRDRRRILTSHEAFRYYADAYGVDFLATMGISTDAEPSARDFARLVAQIKKERLDAVFLERGVSPRLMEQLARETGVKIGGMLYADTLSPPDGPAATYIEMMRSNTKAIVAALSA